MSPFSARIALAATLSAVLFLAGCATVSGDKRQLALQAATARYDSALRWGYFDTAYAFVQPDLRANKPLPDVFKDLQVTGYDVVQQPIAPEKDSTTAVQVATIDYIHQDRQVLKRLVDRQVWVWDPKLESWWLKSGLPAFE
jgi:hypothetical protein